MAILVDESTANITWKSTGAVANCHTGQRFAILHCTAGANLGAGDSMPAGKVRSDDAMQMEASVFVEATANEFDMGDREFGIIQLTELLRYEFLYAGRIESEGSCMMDMLKGFTANPSLDVQRAHGGSIDERIFDIGMQTVDRVKTPRTGFNVTLRFGDHPHNTIPYRFQNNLTKARNFLARAWRVQTFSVYFVTRANVAAPLTILGSLGWVARWKVDFTWTGNSPTPRVNPIDLYLAPSVVGFQRGPAPGDSWSAIALNRTLPTTNKLDDDTSRAIFDQRRAPMLDQSRTRPADLRADFFT
jgi:hypothetical protein